MAQTMRHLAVLTYFVRIVPLAWHDSARHIAGHCGDRIRASVWLAYADEYKELLSDDM